MCRLLSTFEKPKAWMKIISDFQKQANNGEIPPIPNIESGHKDGWGMAKSNEDNSGMEIIGTYLGSAMEAEEYCENIKSLSNPPRIFMCHLRKASPGVQITLANTHPFQYKNWAFSHNGTVYDANKLLPNSEYRITSDESDSEYLFHYLLGYMHDETLEKTIPEKIIQALLDVNVSFTSMNSMFSNGSDLYAIRYCIKHEDYYSLFYYESKDGIVISSERIHIPELDANLWKEIPNRSVMKVSDDHLKVKIFQF